MARSSTFSLDYQPKSRRNHSTVRVGNCLYMWGGYQRGMPNPVSDISFRSLIEIYDLSSGKWEQKTTTGNPPLGIWGYCAAAIGSEIYYFGGKDGNNYYNSIHSLNVDTLHWRAAANSRGHPSKKAYCGMVPIQINKKNYLAVFGGECSATDNIPHQPTAQYDKVSHSMYYTNEVHYYEVSIGQ